MEQIGIKKELKLINLYAVIALIINIIVAKLILHSPFWHNYSIFLYEIFEFLSFLVSFIIFLIVWYTYENNKPAVKLLGFGFFIVAILEIFHIFYGFVGFEDFSLEYSIVLRLVEGMVLFIISTRTLKFRLNKWFGLFCSSLIIVCVFYSLQVLRISQNILLNENGIGSAYNLFELFLIGLFLIGLYRLRDKILTKELIIYYWIYLAFIVAAISNICLILNNVYSAYFQILAHLLRVTYYYFLFRGIIVSVITFPYKKLEENIKYTNEILNEMPLAITTYDSDYKLTFANRKAEELLGYNFKDFAGLKDTEITKKIFASEGSLTPLIRCFKDGHPQILQNQLRIFTKASGEKIKLVIDAYKLNSGKFLYLFDEAKKIQAIENMQLQTRTILDAVNNAVLVFDKSKKVIICNKEFEEASELNSKDIVGKNIDEIADLIKISERGLANKVLSGQIVKENIQARIITPTGHVKEFLLHTGPILDIDSDIIGAIAIASDITKMKQDQEIIQQQEKLALLGQMAAGIVHEVKNPLTAILGYSQLINFKSNDEAIKEYAQAIERESKGLDKIVSDFLNFAKPRPPKLEESSLVDIIDSMRLLIETNTFKKGIKVEYNLANTNEKIMLDENQIKQVILNIIKNAIDAMEETPKPKLIIQTGFDNITSECYLSIYNNGKIMSEEEKMKLATPFYTTKEKGTGLGMSISYQIIQSHSGRIEIESSKEHGTTFTLVFPINDKYKNPMVS
ncbi:MAG: ATP-binding protein [Bacillota bacterium]